MTVRRRSKSRKLRGRTRTMGWGRVGQHRKSGSRGGFGLVGYHKHKWSLITKLKVRWYGKHGFKSPRAIALEINEINVGELNEAVDELVKRGLAQVEGDRIVVDVAKLGYSKVLGRGKVDKKIKLITPSITELAKRKIEEAGGEVSIIRGSPSG